MKAFSECDGILIPMPQPNLDTDRIIPKQYLKTVQRTGLGVYLFDTMRYHDEGWPGKDAAQRQPNQDFVLNHPSYNQDKQSKILLTYENFGCGSSREHAVWSLLDYGIEVVIAPSFAEIFFINCAKNGLLSVELSRAEINQLIKLAQESPGSKAQVKLEEQQVIADKLQFDFEIESTRKKFFLEGLDDIGLSLEFSSDIKSFEERHYAKNPWLKEGIN